jgi:RHS repeat-associated protein
VRQGYTGYQKDNESGLEFAQARYYNTGHGRFTSVDPMTASAAIRNPQTLNRYSYALNSPYKFTDPLGLMFKLPDWMGGGGGCFGNSPTGELSERILRNLEDAGYDVEWLQRHFPRAQQDDGKKKSKKSGSRKKKASPPVNVQAGASAPVNEADDVVQVGPAVGISLQRENELAVSIASELIDGHFDEQALIKKAAINKPTDVAKAAVQDVAESLDPSVSLTGGMTGVNGGVSINLPSPARIMEALALSDLDTRSQIAANRIDTETRVNKVLGKANVQYQNNGVDDAQITRSLAASAQRGIEMYKRAVISTPLYEP